MAQEIVKECGATKEGVRSRCYLEPLVDAVGVTIHLDATADEAERRVCPEALAECAARVLPRMNAEKLKKRDGQIGYVPVCKSAPRGKTGDEDKRYQAAREELALQAEFAWQETQGQLNCEEVTGLVSRIPIPHYSGGVHSETPSLIEKGKAAILTRLSVGGFTCSFVPNPENSTFCVNDADVEAPPIEWESYDLKCTVSEFYTPMPQPLVELSSLEADFFGSLTRSFRDMSTYSQAEEMLLGELTGAGCWKYCPKTP